MQLKAKVKLQEKQKNLLKQQAQITKSKAIIFDMLFRLAEKEYQIELRKIFSE